MGISPVFALSGPCAGSMTERNLPNAPPPRRARRRNPRDLALNLLIVALAIVVGYLGYSLVVRQVTQPPVDPMRSGVAAGEIIQLDVLNGCGANGAAIAFTSFLRARGYDVVEMRNYKAFDVEESLVIDRTGNRKNAEQVAYALGIKKENILQQLNQDYYVDVSVVIGKDHTSLKPSREGGIH
jgi:hypothetical protein